MQCWRSSHDWEVVEDNTAGALPPARFRGEPFPDLVALASGGPGRLLGCSSTGAVALWDTERCATAHRRISAQVYIKFEALSTNMVELQ